MDLETENRIAAILLKEAAEMRRQAQKEGALTYLQQPTVRSKPNSRFLTATVRGVQQANCAVEVNEMWRIREKQLELENRLHFRNKSHSTGHGDVSEHRRCKNSGSNDVETGKNSPVSSKKRRIHDLDSVEEEGLRDEEVDEFLQSRTKRGRGGVGSRMDEAGPYLPYPDSEMNALLPVSDADQKKARVVLRPERPYSLRCSGSSDDDSSQDEKRANRSSSKLHLRKRKSKAKLRDKKKKKEKRRKHQK